MAEFSYLKEKRRMLDSLGRKSERCNNVFCKICPLSSSGNGREYGCEDFEVMFPEEAEAIVRKWSEEHPIITNADKFKEVFGFDIDVGRYATACVGIHCYGRSCNDCQDNGFWYKEYKKPEEIK